MTRKKGTPTGRPRTAPWEEIKELFLSGRSAARIGIMHGLHHTSVLYILRTQGVDTSHSARKAIRAAMWEKRRDEFRAQRTIRMEPHTKAREEYLAAQRLAPSPRIERMMEIAAPRRGMLA
jgi:hypothetical protein